MIGLDSAQNVRFVQLRAFLFVTCVSDYVFLTPECQMFFPPSMLTLSLAATRIHRLADHASARARRNEQFDITPIPSFSALNRRRSDPISLQKNDRVKWKDRKTIGVPISPSLPVHMDVDVSRAYEQEQTLDSSQ